MFDDYKICPYTGLRPFTEDESIYFKGRDEHIEQATRQLEKNKFIMLTGASGDGKSSLVYAGIVPNAKAGFLKATFSNWAVVDFRPERSPLSNLSKALATHLGVNADTVRTELSYGFSALVDMYKSSSLYHDTHSASWMAGDEQSRNEKKRKAANLIILADQFEEFFTNPENFLKGIPSQEAMSVTNLLLETARIALEEGLPIYVVITMRSDFIGQCAAFRGLPEYIGFSQFFVPRLNRKELREVIEEPAALSGNTIERRLTERLIHDIVEGTDQLPILQHALNQIWKMADEGQTTMDLVHYAMVGGMKGHELPPADAVQFDAWFTSLPPNVRRCYDEPNLQNVLNTHADKLFLEAANHLKALNKGDVTDDDARLVIKTAFKCLTKINDGRAVRNRMTLGEITAIIGVPHLTHSTVGKVLDIFREPGNTLLRPFSEETPTLAEHDVLDITHESLIRNWEYLEQWAKEEYNNYTISRDFGQQLTRWISSNKSKDFLLYIGPLTYFESWVNKEKPNAAWLARYFKGDLDNATKLERANAIQQSAAEFLKRSARRHMVTRTVVRYGAGRIAAVLALIAFFTFGGFMANNYWRQQNAYVLNELKNKALTFANEQQVTLSMRGRMLAEALLQGNLSVREIVASASQPVAKIDLALTLATRLVYQGGYEPRAEILQSLGIVDSLLELHLSSSFENPAQIAVMLKKVNDQQDLLELAYFYNPVAEIDKLRKSNATRAATAVLHVLRTQPKKFTDIANLNRLLEHAVNHKALTTQAVDELINVLSPFDGKPSGWVAENYARGKLCLKGFFSSSFAFNGLYQELAYLYGAKGNATLALQCVDSLLTYDQVYYQNDYSIGPDNAYHIAASFYTYGNLEGMDAFVRGYVAHTKTTEADFYARLVARCKLYEYATAVTDNDVALDIPVNLSLEHSSHEQLAFFFNKYRQVLRATEKNPAQRDLQLALAYKDEGILHLRKLEVTGATTGKEKYTAMFDTAVSVYRRIDPAFLNGKIDVVDVTGGENLSMSRKFLFLYPDIRTPFHPNEHELFHYFFVSGTFLDYIQTHNLFSEFYKTDEELGYFEIFLRHYHINEADIVYTASNRLSYSVLASLEKNIADAHALDKVNLQFLYLYLGHLATSNNEPDRARYYYAHLAADKLNVIFLNSFNPGFAMPLMGRAVADLAKMDRFEDADKVVKMLPLPINRSSAYAFAAQELLLQNINDNRADRLIDSASVQSQQTRTSNAPQNSRVQLAYALALRNRANDSEAAIKAIKNVEVKNFGFALIARGLAREENVFKASQFVNDNFSLPDNTFFLQNIFQGYNETHTTAEKDKHWSHFKQNHSWLLDRPITYVDENH